jgi:two-component system, NarL family, response regulator DevR
MATKSHALERPQDRARLRVFLVDDHHLFRLGIRTRLEIEPDIEVVGEAGSVARASEALEGTRPDVVVVDIHLKDGDGLDLAGRIREQLPEARVVILSGSEDHATLHRAIVAGASAYVLKDDDPDEVLTAIRNVGAGETMVDDILSRYMVRHEAQREGERGSIATLTAQERRVLDLLGEGLTNREIAERLFLAEKTVRNHVSAVLRKLRVSHRTQAALYSAEHGRP